MLAAKIIGLSEFIKGTQNVHQPIKQIVRAIRILCDELREHAKKSKWTPKITLSSVTQGSGKGRGTSWKSAEQRIVLKILAPPREPTSNQKVPDSRIKVGPKKPKKKKEIMRICPEENTILNSSMSYADILGEMKADPDLKDLGEM